MEEQRAPFYLRRTKEAMVRFPEQRKDGSWAAKPVFTKRITRTVSFTIDGPEMDLYADLTRFVKRQCALAADRGHDNQARAVGFVMSMYQRRLASSTYAIRRSLENRARRLAEGLESARALAKKAPPVLPSESELEEMEDAHLGAAVLERIRSGEERILSSAGMWHAGRLSMPLRSENLSAGWRPT